MPDAVTPFSSWRGTSAITSAPASGRSVAIVIAEFSQLMLLPLSDLREDDGQHHDAREQEHGVPLDVARLDVPQQASGEAGDVREAVHGPVDHVFVEPVHAP